MTIGLIAHDAKKKLIQRNTQQEHTVCNRYHRPPDRRGG